MEQDKIKILNKIYLAYLKSKDGLLMMMILSSVAVFFISYITKEEAGSVFFANGTVLIQLIFIISFISLSVNSTDKVIANGLKKYMLIFFMFDFQSLLYICYFSSPNRLHYGYLISTVLFCIILFAFSINFYKKKILTSKKLTGKQIISSIVIAFAVIGFVFIFRYTFVLGFFILAIFTITLSLNYVYFSFLKNDPTLEQKCREARGEQFEETTTLGEKVDQKTSNVLVANIEYSVGEKYAIEILNRFYNSLEIPPRAYPWLFAIPPLYALIFYLSAEVHKDIFIKYVSIVLIIACLIIYNIFALRNKNKQVETRIKCVQLLFAIFAFQLLVAAELIFRNIVFKNYLYLLVATAICTAGYFYFSKKIEEKYIKQNNKKILDWPFFTTIALAPYFGLIISIALPRYNVVDSIFYSIVMLGIAMFSVVFCSLLSAFCALLKNDPTLEQKCKDAKENSLKEQEPKQTKKRPRKKKATTKKSDTETGETTAKKTTTKIKENKNKNKTQSKDKFKKQIFLSNGYEDHSNIAFKLFVENEKHLKLTVWDGDINYLLNKLSQNVYSSNGFANAYFINEFNLHDGVFAENLQPYLDDILKIDVSDENDGVRELHGHLLNFFEQAVKLNGKVIIAYV